MQPLASNPAGIGRTVQLEDFHVTVLQSKSVDFFIKLHADLFTCTINKNGCYMD